MAVPQQVARQLVKGKGLPHFLSCPLGGRVGGHIEVKNATSIMVQYQKHVKDVKTDGGQGEEVDRDQLREVVLQCAPCLKRRSAMYLLALVPPMSMPSLSSSPWMRAKPQLGFSRRNLRIRSRTSREMTGRRVGPLPPFRPEQAKTGTLPGHDKPPHSAFKVHGPLPLSWHSVTTPCHAGRGSVVRVVYRLYGMLLATSSQFLVSENISPVPFTNAP